MNVKSVEDVEKMLNKGWELGFEDSYFEDDDGNEDRVVDRIYLTKDGEETVEVPESLWDDEIFGEVFNS